MKWTLQERFLLECRQKFAYELIFNLLEDIFMDLDNQDSINFGSNNFKFWY
jgi:hypothetical protein